MRLALICAAAALATASLASAAEPAPSTATATATKEATAKKPRKVCRRDTSTGSTIPKKVCRTIPEPAAQAKQDAAPQPHAGHAHDAGSAE